MTPDEYEALILKSEDRTVIQKALAPLSNAQRRALSKTADQLKGYLCFSHVLPKNASPRLRAYVCLLYTSDAADDM